MHNRHCQTLNRTQKLLGSKFVPTQEGAVTPQCTATPPVSPFLPPWCQCTDTQWGLNIHIQTPFIHHLQAPAQRQQQSQGPPVPAGILCPLVAAPWCAGSLSGPSCALVGTAGSGGQVARHSDWGCGCSWGSRSGWGAVCEEALQDNSLWGQKKGARGHVPSRVMKPPPPMSLCHTRVISPLPGLCSPYH